MSDIKLSHVSSITFINSNGVIITTEIKEGNKRMKGTHTNDYEGNYVFFEKDLEYVKNIVLTLKPFHKEYEDNIIFRIKKRDDKYRCEWVLLLKTKEDGGKKGRNGNTFADIRNSNKKNECEQKEEKEEIEEKTFDCNNIKDIMLKYVYCVTYFDNYILNLRNEIGGSNSENEYLLNELIKINNNDIAKKSHKEGFIKPTHITARDDMMRNSVQHEAVHGTVQHEAVHSTAQHDGMLRTVRYDDTGNDNGDDNGGHFMYDRTACKGNQLIINGNSYNDRLGEKMEAFSSGGPYHFGGGDQVSGKSNAIGIRRSSSIRINCNTDSNDVTDIRGRRLGARKIHCENEKGEIKQRTYSSKTDSAKLDRGEPDSGKYNLLKTVSNNATCNYGVNNIVCSSAKSRDLNKTPLEEKHLKDYNNGDIHFLKKLFYTNCNFENNNNAINERSTNIHVNKVTSGEKKYALQKGKVESLIRNGERNSIINKEEGLVVYPADCDRGFTVNKISNDDMAENVVNFNNVGGVSSFTETDSKGSGSFINKKGKLLTNGEELKKELSCLLNVSDIKERMNEEKVNKNNKMEKYYLRSGQNTHLNLNLNENENENENENLNENENENLNENENENLNENENENLNENEN
ncbi:hypothetical protein POVCU1_067360, partial [Plasmodium ovale curtisi]